MTECEEVATAMVAPLFDSFDEVVRYVRGRMPDESVTVIDNVAQMMWETQPGSKT